MTYCDIKIYIVISYEIYVLAYIDMTSLKHMFWMEMLSTGVCIAIITLLQYD